MWSTLRDVLKKVVGKHCDRDEAEVIQKKLNTITHYCTCTNNEVRINEMVKTLEQEGIGSRDIFNWFIEVLEDPTVRKNDLVGEIKKKLDPGHRVKYN